MKHVKRILCLGLLSCLFGCDDREELGGNYIYDKNKNKVLYRYVTGGALLPSYKTVPSKYPKTFKVLSGNYAVDKSNVFWGEKLIANAAPEGFEVVKDYPSTFGKNPISQQVVYQENLVDVDFGSAKILSRKYISDKNKVLYIAGIGREKYGLFHKVAVKNPADFQLFGNQKPNGSVLGHDTNTIYLKTLNTQIPSKNAQIISYQYPIILQNDVLHYLYPSYRDIKNFKTLPPHFAATAHGSIGTFAFDTYYHFSVSGFEQATQLAASRWINDKNGFYFINDRKIHKIADKPISDFTYNKKYPNFIRTSEQLIEVVIYPFKVNYYPVDAVILDRWLVRAGKTIYVEGEPTAQVDPKTFKKLNGSHYIDKSFYYSGHKMRSKQSIPYWAYDEILKGRSPNDLFGIDMKHDYTVHKTYWNGFQVSLSIPTKENDSSKVLINFKNIERKKLRLDKPLEQQLHISYMPYNTLSPVYYGDENVKLTPKADYDYHNINPEESIQFALSPNNEMISLGTVKADYDRQVLPRLVLSSNAFPAERKVTDLYLDARIEK